MEDILIPIFVCFLLPVTIVFLVMWTRRNEINKKTEIVLKAIESGQQVNPDLFKSNSKPKTVKQSLLGKLTGACVTSALGIAFLSFGLIIFSDGPGMTAPSGELTIVGGVLLAVGIALFIVFMVGKKMLAKEIEAEESSVKSE